MDIWVKKVVRDHKKAIEVEIQAGNIAISFWFAKGKLRYKKYKPDARVYDPAQLWVPPVLFRKACRQAIAILKEPHKTQTQTTFPF